MQFSLPNNMYREFEDLCLALKRLQEMRDEQEVIDWDDLRAEMLERSDVKAAFDAQERQERLRDMLAKWRSNAGLTRAQVAQRMGVSAPTVSRMEANVTPSKP